jgi:hypothetical protein
MSVNFTLHFVLYANGKPGVNHAGQRHGYSCFAMRMAMAQITKPAIPMKMYRHFAVVTLALTAFLALFASGENEELRQQAVQQRSAHSAGPRPTATPAYGQPELARRGANGQFGDEAGSDNDFGRPTTRGTESRFIDPARLPAANSENAAFTEEYLDSLSEEELDALLRAMREGGIEDSERRQATAIMEAGSRRRSGRAVPVG